MRHTKSILFPHWLKRQNDLFSINFQFLWCMNHDTQEWMNHNTQEWIARYVVVSFDMVQLGSISDKYWILLYLISCSMQANVCWIKSDPNLKDWNPAWQDDFYQTKSRAKINKIISIDLNLPSMIRNSRKIVIYCIAV